jgi:hypothetical protein
MENRSKDERRSHATRDLPMSGVHREQELASLAVSLCRRIASAKAVLLIADALNLPARDLLTYTSKHFRAALREISVKRLGEVVEALSFSEPRRFTLGGSTKALSLDAFARFVLDLHGVGSKLELVEHAIIARAMSACAGNQSAASRLLGIERKALARRLAKGQSEKRG